MITARKGFTLIEMLVVVAIVGILSTVILVALGPSREKSRVTRLIADLNQARTVAEATFTGGSYAGLPDTTANNMYDGTNTVTGNTSIDSIARDMVAHGAPGLGIVTNADGANAISATLYIFYASTGPQYHCVDSAGNSVDLGGAPAQGSAACQ